MFVCRRKKKKKNNTEENNINSNINTTTTTTTTKEDNTNNKEEVTVTQWLSRSISDEESGEYVTGLCLVAKMGLSFSFR